MSEEKKLSPIQQYMQDNCFNKVGGLLKDIKVWDFPAEPAKIATATSPATEGREASRYIDVFIDTNSAQTTKIRMPQGTNPDELEFGQLYQFDLVYDQKKKTLTAKEGWGILAPKQQIRF